MGRAIIPKSKFVFLVFMNSIEHVWIERVTRAEYDRMFRMGLLQFSTYYVQWYTTRKEAREECRRRIDASIKEAKSKIKRLKGIKI